MILEPKHKNFTGPLQIKETIKEDLISGAWKYVYSIRAKNCAIT